MNMYDMQLIPRDLLFMRDARPMEASDAGLGANWPRPDQLFNAMINALHHQWPNRQEWEGAEHTRNLPKDKNQDSSFRFGALMTVGPFPMKTSPEKSEIFFPCPLDVSADESGMLWPMRLVDGKGTNLPAPLTKMLSAQVLGKTSIPQWISAADYVKYLRGESFRPKACDLFDAERAVGIALSPHTGTTIEGKLYQGEYLRLREGVSMAVRASCEIKPKGQDGTVDVLSKLDLPMEMVMGGQQGVVSLQRLSAPLELPTIECNPKKILRWTLLSPMIAINGWCPGWIDSADGSVKLKEQANKLPRLPHESREAWRKRCNADSAFIKARLIAARIGKPVCFSGWDLTHEDSPTGVPKATQVAVPAGAAYYFECEDDAAFRQLWNALNANARDSIIRRSDLYGEKGFGLGICSSMN